VLFLGLILLVTGLACGVIDKPAAAVGPGPPFAVVELFTSEGCSSCPLANELLGELHAEARRSGRRIFPLAFHIDYLDGQGWRDPYGDAAHSRRQRQYGQALDLSSSYTPQMIVNGREEFVGSDGKRARREIEAALSRPAPVDLFLRADLNAQGDGIEIEYQALGETKGAVLNLVLAQSGLTSEVDSGEDTGRNLSHECVVRRFETIELEGASVGHFEMALPHQELEVEYAIVGYLQDPRSMTILGAVQIDLR
jgi:hypothetical protein